MLRNHINDHSLSLKCLGLITAGNCGKRTCGKGSGWRAGCTLSARSVKKHLWTCVTGQELSRSCSARSSGLFTATSRENLLFLQKERSKKGKSRTQGLKPVRSKLLQKNLLSFQKQSRSRSRSLTQMSKQQRKSGWSTGSLTSGGRRCRGLWNSGSGQR